MSATRDISELRRAAKAPVKSKGGGKTLADYFDMNKGSIAKALPQHVTADRMLRVALQAVRTTPALQECSIESIFGSVVQCATLGLEPNDTRGLAYLVPFYDSQKRQKECQMIVGYRGFIDLAKRGGNVAHIVGRVVREKDELQITQGTHEELVHRPYMGGDRGEIVGAYAIAQMRGDDPPLFYFMPWADLEAARNGSAGAWYFDKKTRTKKPKESSPWWAHTEAMCQKTAVRRIAKWLPMSIELADAVALADKAESGQSQNMGGVLDGEYSLVDSDAPAISADDPDQSDAPAPRDTPASVEPPQADDKPLADRLIERIQKATDGADVQACMDEAEIDLEKADADRVATAGNARLADLNNGSELE